MSKAILIGETKEQYDVIVVGSGMTGGWAAKEFCEKGLKTLMIERGRFIEHRKDYIGEGKGPWEFEHRTKVDNLLTDQQYNVQKECYAFSDATKHFFGNDRDLPYSTEKGSNFTWIRANQLGGKSLLWHRQSYRFSEFDFRTNKQDGHGVDWPINYKDLAPWYTKVEEYAGISGTVENLENLPDSEFLPGFQLNDVETFLKAKIESNYPDRKLIIGRTAHLSKPKKIHLDQGRYQCQTRDECHKGCSFGAYFSTLSSTLPAAVATGNLHIAPNSVVHSLIYDQNKKKVLGVRVIDNEDLSTREYFAKVVFLCASTLASTQIMLNSTSKTFPNGIANSSNTLGHYLMDHCYNAVANGDVDGFEDSYYSGRRPTGIYIPNFQYELERYNKKYLRGFAFGGGAFRKNWQSLQHQNGIGSDYKNALTKIGGWGFGIWAQGEMLPRYENQVSLHSSKTDKWGMPQLHINCQWSDNERLMMQDAADIGANMLTKIGVKNVKSNTTIDTNPPGLAIHEVGTARMGRDPKTSVLNGFNQSHDIGNLFVTDGSSFSSSGVVNPSLTFMALTVRAVDYCVNELKQKRI